MLHAVIMAGGAGTRFWPASRVREPKQLLNLFGNRTMIQSTVDRLEGIVSPQRIMIVTNEALVEPIAAQLPEVPRSLILGEPCKRDTAPCIGLAAGLIARHDPDATLVVMPADHIISPPEAFQSAIQAAVRMVERQPDCLVTFGIQPTYPATTYGYIERGERAASETTNAPPAFHVRRFREKPDLTTAEEFLKQGGFYWNAGIFVWKSQTILKALQEYEPAMLEELRPIVAAHDSRDFNQVFAQRFAAIRGKSIDFAVMERHKKVMVLEAPFAWDDVGNWRSLARTRGHDTDGNTIVGRHVGVNTQDTIVRTDDEHLVVTVGMKNCIVVHTPDATLVAHRDDEESVRKVVERLKELGWEEYL